MDEVAGLRADPKIGAGEGEVGEEAAGGAFVFGLADSFTMFSALIQSSICAAEGACSVYTLAPRTSSTISTKNSVSFLPVFSNRETLARSRNPFGTSEFFFS